MNKVIHCTKRCLRRVKGFAIRGTIVVLAIAAIFVVMVFTGEIVTFGLAVQRLTEALGYALADTLADS
jgi:hypothetical protein